MTYKRPPLWTADDDAHLLASQASDAELAEHFGRSLKAVRCRRWKLMERGACGRTVERKVRGRFGVAGKVNRGTAVIGVEERKAMVRELKLESLQ